jgi:hypothetical protein
MFCASDPQQKRHIRSRSRRRSQRQYIPTNKTASPAATNDLTTFTAIASFGAPGGPDTSNIFPRFRPPKRSLSAPGHAVENTLAVAFEDRAAADCDAGRCVRGRWEAEKSTREAEIGIRSSAPPTQKIKRQRSCVKTYMLACAHLWRGSLARSRTGRPRSRSLLWSELTE